MHTQLNVTVDKDAEERGLDCISQPADAWRCWKLELRNRTVNGPKKLRRGLHKIGPRVAFHYCTPTLWETTAAADWRGAAVRYPLRGRMARVLGAAPLQGTKRDLAVRYRVRRPRFPARAIKTDFSSSTSIRLAPGPNLSPPFPLPLFFSPPAASLAGLCCRVPPTSTYPICLLPFQSFFYRY